MFGPVSLSNSYPDEAKSCSYIFIPDIFWPRKNTLPPKNPFVFSRHEEEEFASYFGF
jgi:hypothetical protein